MYNAAGTSGAPYASHGIGTTYADRPPEQHQAQPNPPRHPVSGPSRQPTRQSSRVQGPTPKLNGTGPKRNRSNTVSSDPSLSRDPSPIEIPNDPLNPSSQSTDKSSHIDLPPPSFPYYGQQINIGFPHLANAGLLHYTSTQPRRANGSHLGLPASSTAYLGELGLGVGNHFGRQEDWLDTDGHNAHPLYQPGSAIESLTQLTASIDSMMGGDIEQWSDLFAEYFDEGARVQLTLASDRTNGLKLYDLLSTSLPRVLKTLGHRLQSSMLFLRNHVESPIWSPPQSPDSTLPFNSFPRHGIQVESEGEWVFNYVNRSSPDQTHQVSWKVTSKSNWVGVMSEGILQLETWDLMVEEWSSEGASPGTMSEWGLPQGILQLLDVSQEMEGVTDILGVHPDTASARDALSALTIVKEAGLTAS